MVTVEELYKAFEVLADADDKASEHEESYLLILSGVKGGPPEKKLACQFISRFFKHFPKLAEEAIDAELDLCEDEDGLIRRQAIKSLPDFCGENNEHLQRIADILSQLLQTEDAVEASIVKSGLDNLMKKEAKGTLNAILFQIASGDDSVRDKAIKYLKTTVQGPLKEIYHANPETEKYLFDESKKVLSDVTGEEFKLFMVILSKLKSIGSNPQCLADLIAEQAELDSTFEVSDADSLDRLITCTRQLLPFLEKGASAEKFGSYFLKQVLPVFEGITTPQDAGDFKLEVLKVLSEIASHIPEELAKESTEQVYKLLLEYMPHPPIEKEEKEESEAAEENQLNFSYTECLLYTFHCFAKKNEEFLSSEEATERLNDFKIRLQYFAMQLKIYIKQLSTALQGKTGPVLEEKENKMKVVALKTTSNINILIKDLFRNPPTYKSAVVLSWKSKENIVITKEETPGAAKTSETVEDRRKRAGITPITFESSPSDPKKKSASVYTPPSRRENGQSNRYSSYNQNRRGGFSRGYGRGYNRGRGYGRNTYDSFLLR